MKKQVLAVFIALIVLAVTAFGVLAETATIDITGGSLSVTTAPIALSDVALTGTDTTASSAATANTWTAVDPTGSGDGWNLTIESSDFTAGEHSIDISEGDQNFTIQLLQDDVDVVNGNTDPVSQATAPMLIPDSGAPSKFLIAAVTTGMGTYTLTPSFVLEVPAETYAGAYSATVTVSINAGP